MNYTQYREFSQLMKELKNETKRIADVLEDKANREAIARDVAINTHRGPG